MQASSRFVSPLPLHVSIARSSGVERVCPCWRQCVPLPSSAGWATTPAGTAYPIPAHGAGPADIRDRLIELDDLRQRRIISEEEFAAKKAELLSRI